MPISLGRHADPWVRACIGMVRSPKANFPTMGRGAGRIWRPPAPRVERARGPSPTSFGLDNGTSIDSGQATRLKGGWRGGGQSGRGRFCGARHTPALHSHTCARARDTHRCGVQASTAAREADAGIAAGARKPRPSDASQTSTATRRRELPRDWQRLRGRIDLSVPTHWHHWQRPTTCYYRGTGSVCAARVIPASQRVPRRA